MSDIGAKTVIFFDGSCPLCRSEVGIYRKSDVLGALCLIDVSKASATLPKLLNREKAMSRFHVMARDGRMLSGAAAFIEVWQLLRGWRWAAKIAALAGLTSALECA